MSSNEQDQQRTKHLIVEDPMDIQIDGSHYKDMVIQPFEFCMKNNLNAGQTHAIKYICRYNKKGGKKDLKKAIHLIQMLINYEYPE